MRFDLFFSSDETRKALEAAKISPEKVDVAVSTLSDEELARLASRADNLDRDFAAGRLSDRDLLIVILGLAALVLIVVVARWCALPPSVRFIPRVNSVADLNDTV